MGKKCLRIYKTMQSGNAQHHSQCVHVADGPSGHYRVCYCFLELPVRKRAIQHSKQVLNRISKKAIKQNYILPYRDNVAAMNSQIIDHLPTINCQLL